MIIWRIGWWCHQNIEAEWFWMIWWRLGSRWVYPLMYWAKRQGYAFAQPFAEGYPQDATINVPLNDRS